MGLVEKPKMECPMCGEICYGGLAFSGHISRIHSSGEAKAYRTEIENEEIEAKNGNVRRQERLDNFTEFGG